MAAVDLCVFCAEGWESAFSKPLSSARTAHMHTTYWNMCSHRGESKHNAHTDKEAEEIIQARTPNPEAGTVDCLFIVGAGRGGQTQPQTQENVIQVCGK